MKIQAILFDLDGTLLNTLEDLTDAVNFALRESNYQERTLEEVKAFLGNGVQKLVERAVPNGTIQSQIEACLLVFKKYYSTHMQDKTKPYDGILPLLKQLRQDDYKIGIVSNKFDQAVKQLQRDYFEGLVDVAIGESSAVRKKPAPDCVFHAIQELDTFKDGCLYVGDSDVDVKTAHNAGILCIGVTWGFRNREVLIHAGADYIVDNPLDILAVIGGNGQCFANSN